MGALDGATILVTGSSVGPDHLAGLRRDGAEVRNPAASFPPGVLSPTELVAALQGADAYLLGGHERATAEVLAAAPSLRLLAFLGVGYQSYVDGPAARAQGITVTNTPDVPPTSVAEFAVGALLAARCGLVDHELRRRGGEPAAHPRRTDLAGRPIGVLGMGSIGTRVARTLVHGFEVEVHYASRTRRPETEAALGLRWAASLRELVVAVDALVVAVPETPQTRGMVGASALGALPPGAGLELVDTARPEVCDPAGVLSALDSGRLASATYDGWYRAEDDGVHRLAAHPGVRVTPHVAARTHGAAEAMATAAIDDIRAVLTGGTPRFGVDPGPTALPEDPV